MDYEVEDLFNFNDDLYDDEVIQENDESEYCDTGKQVNLIDFTTLFNCSGEISTNDSTINHEQSIVSQDLKSVLQGDNFKLPDDDHIELFNFSFDPENLPLDILIQITRTNIQRLATSIVDEFSKSSNSFLSIRENITKFMLCLRSQDQISESQFQMLRISLGSFDSMPNFFASIHSSISKDGNSSKSSSYHLLHGQLEWRWIHLTTIYKLEKLRSDLYDETSEFRTELILLLHDLVDLSLAKFLKCNNANIIFTSSIICSCVKELCIVLFNFISELHCETMSFWKIVGHLLNDLTENKNSYENFLDKKILLRSSNRVTCKNIDQFNIWFMCDLIKILQNVQNDSTNEQSYDVFQNFLKKFLRIEQSEENLRVLLVIISEVIQDAWGTKTDILMMLWENFQKKINSPFFITGQAPNSLAVSSVTAQLYLEKIKMNQKSTSKLNINSTSFDMFVILLGKQVERLTSSSQRIQVQKILGRIYTKFPTSKLQTLNEMGIHNLLKLFLTLSISTNFSDVAKKFSEILIQVPMEKPNNQQQIMKGHMAMLILYRENGSDISCYAEKLMNLINNLIDKCASGLHSSLKIISDTLPVIISNSEDDDNFENGEDRLIDVWMEKYLQSSTISEQDRVYESLIKIIKKLRDSKNSLPTSNVIKLIQKIFTILLPHCKQFFGKSESTCLPLFCGNLCLLSNDFQELTIPRFEVLFKTFLDVNNGSNTEHIIQFLCTVVENSTTTIKQLDRVLVIQHWIRCSVLLPGNNTNMKELTRLLVIKMDEFKFLSETARTQSEIFVNNKEPICVFLADIGKKYALSSNQSLKFNLIEKLYSYLITFERWALTILHQQQQQSSNQQATKPNSQDESLMRIYTFISLAFLHCSELIYIRSKPNCFFNIAVNQFLLPQSLMMGHSQSRPIVLSMFKVWPLLIEGVSRLNFKNDLNIAKVLNDLIVRWAPLLKISSNSKAVAKPYILLTNLKDPETVEYVFGKLAKSFIAVQNRKPNQHACLILTMIGEVLKTVEDDEKKLMLIWRGSMLHVLEAAMMSEDSAPSQMMCYNLLENFARNKHFDNSSQMKALLVKSLQDITYQNLSYHSASYFRFLTKLGKFAPKIISSQLIFISNQIKKCEELRGSGNDTKLRSLFSQLESSVDSA